MTSVDEALPSSVAPQLRIQNESNDKHHLLANLYRTLEDLAYVQCAIILYCDQSLISAFARWNVINNYTSAESVAGFRIPIIIGVNLICFLWHTFGAAPRPVSDGTRGYLSGATVIDLVGEIPPSKLRLLYLDILFFIIQILMVVVGHEQKKVQSKTQKQPTEPVRQDVDAEEQGIHRAEQTDDPAETSTSQELDEDAGVTADLLASQTTNDDESVPMLRLNVMATVKEIMSQDHNLDAAVTDQRNQNRERLRRLLSAFAQQR